MRIKRTRRQTNIICILTILRDVCRTIGTWYRILIIFGIYTQLKLKFDDGKRDCTREVI